MIVFRLRHEVRQNHGIASKPKKVPKDLIKGDLVILSYVKFLFVLVFAYVWMVDLLVRIWFNFGYFV